MVSRAENTRRKRAPGFQGSETSRADVIIYGHGDDPVLEQERAGRYVFEGRTGQRGEAKTLSGGLIGVTTRKGIGEAAGSFQFQVKAPDDPRVSFLDFWTENDVVDIVFTKHGRRFHVMRGFIDDIRREETVVNDATDVVYTFSGRDHGKVWQSTPIFFNRFIGENVGGGATLRAFAANNTIYGNVGQTVEAILYSFLRALNDRGSATWQFPLSVPGIEGRFFSEAVAYRNDDDDQPPRVALNAHMVEVSGKTDLWGHAQKWSDPQFMELFTDLWEVSSNARDLAGEIVPIAPTPEKELDVDQTTMAVILRPRPFPHNAGQDLRDSAWFTELETYEVTPWELLTRSVGRGGAERKNAFFVRAKAIQENAGTNIDLAAPLWDVQDIRRFGLRRLDVQSNYLATDDDLIGMTQGQRQRIRDWYALNPYFYNGQITFAYGRPDIRIGTKLRVLGSQSDEEDETYYIETVQNAWNYRQGLRTGVGVTRGWRGTDQSFMRAITDMQGRYSLANKAVPAQDFEDVFATTGGLIA